MSEFVKKNLEKNLDKQVSLFNALSDPTRLKILKLLGAPPKSNAFCVMAIANILGISQSAVSQHLRVLKAANLVRGKRRGYRVHYFINPEPFGYLLNSIKKIYKTKETKHQPND